MGTSLILLEKILKHRDARQCGAASELGRPNGQYSSLSDREEYK